MTKEASIAPPYCSSCFAAYGPERRYIDFEAAYDGPTVPGVSHNQPIDDLVLCENCLEEAFAILDPKGLSDEVAHLKRELAAANTEIASKDRALVGYGMTVRELEGMAVERKSGRPAVQMEDGPGKNAVQKRLHRKDELKRKRVNA